MFISNRNMPLITQNFSKEYDMLTVERYCKWYNIYKIDKNGEISMVSYLEYNKYNMWYDHTIIPIDIVQFAIEIGAKMDIQSYDAIVRRFISDYISDYPLGTSECEFNHEKHKNMFPTMEELTKVIIDDDLGLVL